MACKRSSVRPRYSPPLPTILWAFVFMEFYVYIIYSTSLNKFYVGYTENIIARLNQHNTGISTFTAKAKDWVVKYSEQYSSRNEAHNRELQIKRKKSRKYIEWLIDNAAK